MSFLNFPDCVPFIDIRRRDFYKCEERPREIVRKSVKIRIACYSVVVCGGILA